MGVISLDDVDAGVLFGPIPPKLTIAEPLVLIGHMTADNTPVLHTVKVSVNLCYVFLRKIVATA